MDPRVKKVIIPVIGVWIAVAALAIILFKVNQANKIEALDKVIYITGTVEAVSGDDVTLKADDPKKLGCETVVFQTSSVKHAIEVLPGDRVTVKAKLPTNFPHKNSVTASELFFAE